MIFAINTKLLKLKFKISQISLDFEQINTEKVRGRDKSQFSPRSMFKKNSVSN